MCFGNASSEEMAVRPVMLGWVRSQLAVVRVGPPVSGALASSGSAVVAGLMVPGMS